MRTDVEFNAEGAMLRGWLFTPDNVSGPSPTIVMAHGFSGVKEQYLDKYAQAFAEAGFAALVFDNRNFGASDGAPRQEIDPIQQVRDYRHAVTYAGTLHEVDPDRIGVWGTSFSGGHALMVAATDRRIKCVVAQVPTINGPVAAQRRMRADLVPGLLAAFDADRVARFHGEAPKTMPVVAEDPAMPCALPGQEAWEFFSGSFEMAPTYRNEVTVRSGEMAREYAPGFWVDKISPTPLLMIVADHDYITPTDLALEAYNAARHPKKLILLKGGHFVPYVAQFEKTSSAATRWFCEHLTGVQAGI